MILLSPQAFPFLHILQQAILAGSVSKPGNSILLNCGSGIRYSVLEVIKAFEKKIKNVVNNSAEVAKNYVNQTKNSIT